MIPYCYPMGRSAATAKLRRPIGAAVEKGFVPTWPPIDNHAMTAHLERAERGTRGSDAASPSQGMLLLAAPGLNQPKPANGNISRPV